MCGLVGYLDLRDERRVEREVLVRMADTVVHRGPDASGYFAEENIGLGFRRLGIIDLEGGHQPMFNEDGSVVLVCNGEIYNYRELTATLKQQGHVFRTNCDVEVLLHLYEEYGADFLNRLNGQFARAITSESTHSTLPSSRACLSSPQRSRRYLNTRWFGPKSI
jgi:asparagine synthase (glutamine-hydrolysing)